MYVVTRTVWLVTTLTLMVASRQEHYFSSLEEYAEHMMLEAIQAV